MENAVVYEGLQAILLRLERGYRLLLDEAERQGQALLDRATDRLEGRTARGRILLLQVEMDEGLLWVAVRAARKALNLSAAGVGRLVEIMGAMEEPFRTRLGAVRERLRGILAALRQTLHRNQGLLAARLGGMGVKNACRWL